MGMDQNANATEEDTNPQREKSSQRSRHLFTMMDHPESEALPLATAVISPRDMNMFSKQPTQQQVTPELAAQIVKDYILPMFESDGKKDLKNKYNKLQGMSSGGIKNADTVYGELKLSQQLLSQLKEVRSKFDFLNETIEGQKYQK